MHCTALHHFYPALLPLSSCFRSRARSLPQAALQAGLSPSLPFRCRNGSRISLLEACFLQNCAMWTPEFEYSEEEGRTVSLAGVHPSGGGSAGGNWQKKQMG